MFYRKNYFFTDYGTIVLTGPLLITLPQGARVEKWEIGLNITRDNLKEMVRFLQRTPLPSREERIAVLQRTKYASETGRILRYQPKIYPAGNDKVIVVGINASGRHDYLTGLERKARKLEEKDLEAPIDNFCRVASHFV